MGMSSEETDPLLVHTGFLRRLAQQLVRDENDREDLIQEAWSTAYAARRRGDPPPRSPRAWLASVAGSASQTDRRRTEGGSERCQRA